MQVTSDIYTCASPILFLLFVFSQLRRPCCMEVDTITRLSRSAGKPVSKRKILRSVSQLVFLDYNDKQQIMSYLIRIQCAVGLVDLDCACGCELSDCEWLNIVDDGRCVWQVNLCV